MQSFNLFCLSTIWIGLFIISLAESRTFTKCEQLQALRAQGIPEDQMADWLCLIEGESNGNAQAMNQVNTDGSWDWGMFQINDRYWCGRDGVGGDCNLDCKNLVDDNLNDDITCAKLIYDRMNFKAWTAWVSRCQGDKPAVPAC